MKTFFLKFFFLGIIALTLGSCTPDHVFKDIRIIENGSWDQQNPQLFEADISDTASLYDISVYLDHLKSYSYENLYLKVSQDISGEMKSDTLSFDLIGKDALFIGKCDEESCRMEALIFSGIKFSKTGKQQFKLEQFTREETLNGVQEIGLIIREYEDLK